LGIFIECLVQNSNNYEPPVAASRNLRQSLKDKYVSSIVSGSLEKFSHLIQKYDHSAILSQMSASQLFKFRNNAIIGPRLSERIADKFLSF
jgi:hypothetical protein